MFFWQLGFCQHLVTVIILKDFVYFEYENSDTYINKG